ncbi:MAG: hypothetical protein IKV10_02450, partial [Alphaproteobacteria bacterium]|nr:hypothetical protein [Alphaproteobacteria bacterium]
MAELLTNKRVQNFIDEFNSASDAQERAQITTKANDVLQRFVSGDLVVSSDALDTFGEFLETFAVSVNTNGDKVMTEIGEKAFAKYEAEITEYEKDPVAKEPKKNRIYSLHSDANQIKFDAVSFAVMQSMGLIDKNKDARNLTPAQVAEEVSAIKLSEEQQTEYAARFVDTVLSDKRLFESVPPRILADAYKATRKALINAKDAKEKDAYQKRFATLASRIDFLIANFSVQFNYWYVDPSNLMDVRDGYEMMFAVRQPDLQDAPGQNQKTKNYNKKINGMIENGRESLLAAIKEYEDLYHLTQLKPEDAEELQERWIEMKKRLGKIELTPETLAVAAKYQFLDENNKPIPQFLDENGQPSLDYKEGYTLDPKGRLA